MTGSPGNSVEQSGVRVPVGIAAIVQENMQLREQNDMLRTELLQMTKELADERLGYKRDIQTLSRKNEMLEVDVRDIRRRNEDLKRVNDELHAENTTSRKRVMSLENQVVGLEDQVRSTDRQITDLRCENDALRAENADLRRRVMGLENQVAGLEGHSRDMDKQVTSLKKHVADQDERISDLSGRITAMEPLSSSVVARESMKILEWFTCVDAIGSKKQVKKTGIKKIKKLVKSMSFVAPTWATSDVVTMIDNIISDGVRRDEGNSVVHMQPFTKSELIAALEDEDDDEEDREIKALLITKLEECYDSRGMTFGTPVKTKRQPVPRST